MNHYNRSIHCVSKKSMWRYLFEHNSNINCPIIIIFGTVVTETTSYWIGGSFFHLTYLVQHHYLGNHKTWKFANSAMRSTFTKSIMVSVAVSKMGMTELIFVQPGVKVNRQYYRDVVLSQQMLPAIKHIVRVPAGQCAGSSRPWHHPAASAGNTWLHRSWPLAAQQSRPKPCWLQDLGSDAAACVRTSCEVVNNVDELKQRLIAVCDRVTVCSRTSLTRLSMNGESDWERVCVQGVDSSNTFYDLLLDWKNSSVNNMLFKCVYLQ